MKHIYLTGLVVLIVFAFAGCADTPDARRAFLPDESGWVGNAVSYGPHRDGQRPGAASPSTEELREDLRLMAEHWSLLRVYSSSEFTEPLLSLIRGEGLNMKVMLGAWIALEEPLDGGDASAGDFAEAAAANRREVDAAIRLARDFPDIVVAVSVGNETQIFWSAHRSPVGKLIDYVREVRANVAVPVTVADDFNYWNKAESRELAAEIDFITLHAHPMWNGVQSEGAVQWLNEQTAVVQEMHGDHLVVIGEAGWATSVHDEGEQARLIKGTPGELEQKRFYDEVRAWSKDERRTVFFFEAFDENWKGGEHPDEVEKHWGLFRSDRSKKLGVENSRALSPAGTHEILVTSEAGEKLASMENVAFQDGVGEGIVISVHPDSTRQTIDGIGSSFTESSAFVLAHLEPEKRRELMEQIYGESGANFSLARTHIGSCDFSVEGKYSYAETFDDAELAAFTIAPDNAGFDATAYPGIWDPAYDLLPMIREALAIKRAQGDSELRIIASAWTAPPWMKDIERWWIPGAPENNWQGDAGSLKPEYVSVYADYLLKYLDAYAAEGVDIWGLTPVNEPDGNGGNWESMYFSPESQNDFVQQHLGPRLKQGKRADTRLLVYDQNRDDLEEWTDVIFADPRSLDHVYGVAVHWYSSTFKVYEDAFERVRARYPQFSIVHTEGCIDNLGGEAPAGIEDPEGFKESGWFDNDAFWWNPNASDWAYAATWAGPGVVDHPMYTPVHRYARDIIVGLDHWMTGWVDWNIVLDREGGPNHVGNFCGAPIMIDTDTQEIYYTPVYYVLAQFSRTIRPGDRAVRTRRALDGLDSDALHACATINDGALLSVQLLNTTKRAIPFKLQIADRYADITIPANSVQTVRVQL